MLMHPPGRRHRSIRLLVPASLSAAIAGGMLLSTPPVRAQNSPEPAKIQPLDLKNGFWELQIHTSVTDLDYSGQDKTVESLFRNATPEQRAKSMADLRAQEAATVAKQQRGTDRKTTSCPLNQGFESKVEIAAGPNCSRTTSSTAERLSLHISCRAPDGTPGAEQISSFERIDAENFKGTVQVFSRVAIVGTVTESFVGHWRGDSCSHPLPSLAVQNGARPKGPGAVASEDPSRVIARINATDVTARQGSDLIGKVPLPIRRQYSGRLPELLQKLYMQHAIVDEAVKLHLDRQAPWNARLQSARNQLFQGVTNYAGDPNIPPAVMAQWQDARGRILWDAYFSQGSTPQENQARLKQEQDKYQIKVLDADFFSDTNGP